VGSLELGRGAADGIIYAISKTALNMAMRKAGIALRERGIVVALLAPGMVDTDMLALSRPGFTSGVTAEDVVPQLAEIIDGLNASYDGRPVSSDGSVLPW
jgi:NAD(P)-dependent dehydrogenase (short-subunit alcohol dehydrogenase family)